MVSCVAALLSAAGVPGHAQDLKAVEAAIMKADFDFSQSVADRNRDRFLSMLAETVVFNGGTSDELRGRAAVMEAWSGFFEKDGPTLTWAPTSAHVVGAGDVGVTVGSAVLRGKRPDGTVGERHMEYVTVWRKQEDGSWKVVFDTGSAGP